MKQTMQDFRSSAVLATKAIIRADTSSENLNLDSVLLSISGRIEASATGVQRLRQIRIVAVATYGIALLLFASAALMFVKSERMFGISILCVFLGWFLFTFSSSLIQGLSKLVCGHRAVGGYCVELEDADSFSKIKLISDDIGFVFFKPALNCFWIEGVTHRYMVMASDVVGVTRRRYALTQALCITFQIAGTESLRIAIVHNPVWLIFVNCLGMSRVSPVYRKIIEMCGEQQPGGFDVIVSGESPPANSPDRKS